jgi:uncharacterized protein YjeT (DUF2065 family)
VKGRKDMHNIWFLASLAFLLMSIGVVVGVWLCDPNDREEGSEAFERRLRIVGVIGALIGLTIFLLLRSLL